MSRHKISNLLQKKIFFMYEFSSPSALKILPAKESVGALSELYGRYGSTSQTNYNNFWQVKKEV